MTETRIQNQEDLGPGHFLRRWRSIFRRGFAPNQSVQAQNQKKQERRETLPPDTFAAAGATLQKEGRSWNEDSFVCMREHGIFAVFDGVGGEKNGDTASSVASLAIQKSLTPISNWLKNNPEDFQTQAEMDEYVSEYLKKAIIAAHQSVLRFGGDGKTTATVAFVYRRVDGQQKFIIANVGDGEAYLVREGKENSPGRFTAKGSNTGLAENEQKILETISTQAQYNQLPSHLKKAFNTRNTISDALGMQNQTPIIHMYKKVAFLPGEKLVLMSDGVTDPLTPNEIIQIIKNPNSNPKQKSEMLVHRAQSIRKSQSIRGKKDDRTAVVVEPVN